MVGQGEFPVQLRERHATVSGSRNTRKHLILQYKSANGDTIFAYLTRFCNIFSVLHKGRILTDALLNEPTCINKRKSRRNAEKYTMPQNRKRKFQKGE